MIVRPALQKPLLEVVMKRKTYRNFCLVMDILQDVKHYTKGEAERLAHKVFEQVEADKGKGNRTADWFLSRILTKEEWEAENQEQCC